MNKWWIWVLALVVLYMVFKEDRPKPASAPSYGQSYSAYDYSTPQLRTFRGYVCTSDCSGHEAGYDWAMAHNIDDESDCTGYSMSFIEGCQAYVEENN